MAYRIKRSDGSVTAAVRRIAGEQIDSAVGEIDDEGVDRHEAVHQVRKRAKKIRALLRLVRADFSDYATENAFFRDAAADLALLRDARALIEAHDKLVAWYGAGDADGAPYAPVREGLAARLSTMEDSSIDLGERLLDIREQLLRARRRCSDWTVGRDGFKAVAPGLEKTYRRACRAMQAAYVGPSTERFHEWRKQVKYHWYHTRLLQNISPRILKAHRRTAKALAEILGDDHDLALLRATLTADPGAIGSAKSVEAVAALIDRRRTELKIRAAVEGSRLLAEKPGRLVKRWRKYWAG